MPQQKLNEMQHRVAVYDAICLQAVILLGSKNMDRLYDNLTGENLYHFR